MSRIVVIQPDKSTVNLHKVLTHHEVLGFRTCHQARRFCAVNPVHLVMYETSLDEENLKEIHEWASGKSAPQIVAFGARAPAGTDVRFIDCGRFASKEFCEQVDCLLFDASGKGGDSI